MLLKRVELQAAQAQYESLIINTCGLILRNPQDGREHKIHSLPYLLGLFLLAVCYFLRSAEI